MNDISISELFEDSIYQTRKMLSGLKKYLYAYPYILRALSIIIFVAIVLILIVNKPFQPNTLDELKHRHQNDMHFRSNKL